MPQPTSLDLPGRISRASHHVELSDRLKQAFQAEELTATKLAMFVSLAAICGVIALVFVLVPVVEAFFYVVVLTVFAAMFIAYYTVRRSGFTQPWHGYLFALAIFALFAYAAFVPNPLDATPWPPQMIHRFDMFVFSFIFLLPFAFSYSPLLMLWAGVVCAITWSLGVAWLYTLPETFTEIPIVAPWTEEEELAAFLDPNYLHLNIAIQNVVIMLMVAAGLAALVARTRRLVFREANAERQRANLARYFAPNVVDRLANRDEPLGAVSSQQVAVLFADIVGFTRMAEHIDPDGTISLLRNFHGRLERAVFDHGGTLDKFLGDGIMATFGTPEPGTRDAIAAINCAKSMLESIDDWNLERAQNGEPPIRLSVGIHYGQAIVGNIGSPRRLEFAVVGDVVNVCARIEALTRQLDCRLAVSDTMVNAVRDQTGERAPDLLRGFRKRGVQPIYGRDEGVPIWSMTTLAK